MAPRRLPAGLHLAVPPSDPVQGNDPLKNSYVGDLHFRKLLEAIAGRLQCLESQHDQDVACLQNKFSMERDRLLAQLSRHAGNGKAREKVVAASLGTTGSAGKDDDTQDNAERGPQEATRKADESKHSYQRRPYCTTGPDALGQESNTQRMFLQEGKQVAEGNAAEAPFAAEISWQAVSGKAIEQLEWKARDEDELVLVHESISRGTQSQVESLKALRPSALEQVEGISTPGSLADSLFTKSTAKQAPMEPHLDDDDVLKIEPAVSKLPVVSTQPGPSPASHFIAAVSEVQDAARSEVARCTCVHATFLGQLEGLTLHRGR